MSREEAAMIYLDNLLGFRGRFVSYHEAELLLTESEKQMLQDAVIRYAPIRSSAAQGGAF